MIDKTQTKYIFTKDGEQSEVKLERWIWGVVYKDGTELQQYEIKDGKGIFHQVGEIDQTQVKLWVLRKLTTEKRIDILLPEGARIIHKYRRYIFNKGKTTERKETVYIFGYKYRGHYHFNFIMPSDTIIQSIDDKPRLTTLGLNSN